jgi:LuxR family maltose regulon positive regulatory protein
MVAARPEGRNQSRDIAHLGIQALVACHEGRLRDTYRLARLALDEAERRSRGGSLATLDARVALGMMFWEYDELDAAHNYFHDALGLCRSAGFARGASDVECRQVRVVISQGRLTEALDRIGQLRQAERFDPWPAWLHHGLVEVEIHCRLALCDLDGIAVIMKSVPPERCASALLARVDLCAGRPDRAVAQLTAFGSEPVHRADRVERLAVLARAQLQLGNRRQADDALRRAIDQSREERYLRRLVEHAGELLPLLLEIAGPLPDLYIGEVLSHAKRTAASGVLPAPTPTLEPLTNRERQILSQLTGHLTQHEIACGMYVSVNTLKTHINRVYRKLGACSRSEAVAVARSHGLV